MPPEIKTSNQLSLTDLVGSGVVIVAGKGGVGKTTVTAVLARAAAESGRRVLVVELDGKPTLDALLPASTPHVEVRHVSAAASLEEYLLDHGFGRIAQRLAATGVIDVVGTAAPGIDDLVVLGKIRQFEHSGRWDVIIVDGPAAGHAITFLTGAAALLDAAPGGPIGEQARSVAAMLRDPARCRVVLVTLPETTPVSELLETASTLEERVGVTLGPIVVDQVDESEPLPDPDTVRFGRTAAQVDDAVAAATFRRARRQVQDDALARLTAALPLPRLLVRAIPTVHLGADDVSTLASEISRWD
ncbi:MAG: ArsA family ATPase [Ilumatobacteraceae bacterium]